MAELEAELASVLEAAEAEDAAESARLAKEAENARLAKEAESARLAKEAEDARLAKEAEDARLAKEAEGARLALAEEARLIEEARAEELLLDELKLNIRDHVKRRGVEAREAERLEAERLEAERLEALDAADALERKLREVDAAKESERALEKARWSASCTIQRVARGLLGRRAVQRLRKEKKEKRLAEQELAKIRTLVRIRTLALASALTFYTLSVLEEARQEKEEEEARALALAMAKAHASALKDTEDRKRAAEALAVIRAEEARLKRIETARLLEEQREKSALTIQCAARSMSAWWSVERLRGIRAEKERRANRKKQGSAPKVVTHRFERTKMPGEDAVERLVNVEVEEEKEEEKESSTRGDITPNTESESEAEAPGIELSTDSDTDAEGDGEIGATEALSTLQAGVLDTLGGRVAPPGFRTASDRIGFEEEKEFFEKISRGASREHSPERARPHSTTLIHADQQEVGLGHMITPPGFTEASDKVGFETEARFWAGMSQGASREPSREPSPQRGARSQPVIEGVIGTRPPIIDTVDSLEGIEKAFTSPAERAALEKVERVRREAIASLVEDSTVEHDEVDASDGGGVVGEKGEMSALAVVADPEEASRRAAARKVETARHAAVKKLELERRASLDPDSCRREEAAIRLQCAARMMSAWWTVSRLKELKAARERKKAKRKEYAASITALSATEIKANPTLTLNHLTVIKAIPTLIVTLIGPLRPSLALIVTIILTLILTLIKAAQSPNASPAPPPSPNTKEAHGEVVAGVLLEPNDTAMATIPEPTETEKPDLVGKLLERVEVLEASAKKRQGEHDRSMSPLRESPVKGQEGEGSQTRWQAEKEARKPGDACRSGVEAQMQGNTREAAMSYLKALAVDPSHGESLVRLGMLRYWPYLKL